nr:hypothetical protein [Tolivirales sp.]
MTTTLHDTIRLTSSSRWSTPMKYATLLKYKFLRWCCCLDDALLEMMVDDAYLRDEVRDRMVEHEEGSGSAAVSIAMRAVYVETGYDLSDFRARAQAAAARPIGSGSDDEGSDVDDDLGSPVIPHPPTTQVRVVPRFVSSVVLYLRSKHGNQAYNEANRLMMEREYLRICREVSVRNVDTVAHQQCVLNAYFTEGVHEQLSTTRVRAPQWLREAYGSVPRVTPTVC